MALNDDRDLAVSRLMKDYKSLNRTVERLTKLESGGSEIIPAVRVYNDADISISNNTNTILTFNTERWDNDSIHDTTTNTSRLTCKTAGIYHIYGNIRWGANQTGYRIIAINVNTTRVAAERKRDTATHTYQSISTDYVLAVDDYVELEVYQDSGGALTVVSEGNFSPEFGMTYLGRLS